MNAREKVRCDLTERVRDVASGGGTGAFGWSAW